MAKKTYPDGRVRDLSREYASYHGKPEKIAERASRNAARAAVEKRSGNLPTTSEVDHIRSLKKGGTNAPSNLRVVGKTENRKKGGK